MSGDAVRELCEVIAAGGDPARIVALARDQVDVLPGLEEWDHGPSSTWPIPMAALNDHQVALIQSLVLLALVNTTGEHADRPGGQGVSALWRRRCRRPGLLDLRHGSQNARYGRVFRRRRARFGHQRVASSRSDFADLQKVAVGIPEEATYLPGVLDRWREEEGAA